jgi:drug/metabolite transporter (DMT)-like permease
MVIGVALAATVFFALSTALKHRSASTVSVADRQGTAWLGHFLAATLSNRWWLAAIGADAVGLALQAFALQIGAVSVVQPVLVTALLFSLILNHAAARTRITVREVGWGAVLAIAVGTFLVVSGATTAGIHSSTADRGAAAAVAVLALVLGGGCVVVARRLPTGGRAALLGVVVGTIYACTAVLLKAVTGVASRGGIAAVLTSWQLPVLVVAGAAGMVLAQLAFRSGPLNASLPAMATIDPLLSVVLGLIVYDEQLRTGLLPTLGEVASLAALAIAAVALSRISADQDEQPVRS